jgi:RNA polymerase sigma-70 factor (ECF subfamily)
VELALTPTLDLPRDELEQAFERDRSRLLRIAGAILRDPDEAEDVVQQTLLAVIRARRSGEIRLPSSYLARAVRWNAIKRQSQRARVLPLETAAHDSATPASPADRLDAIELERAIARLPIAQQTVIRLRFYLGLSFREIGKNLSISTNTAASRTRYALARLRHLLAPAHHPDRSGDRDDD